MTGKEIHTNLFSLDVFFTSLADLGSITRNNSSWAGKAKVVWKGARVCQMNAALTRGDKR